MVKIFASPSTYVQGPGALYDSADYIKKIRHEGNSVNG